MKRNVFLLVFILTAHCSWAQHSVTLRIDPDIARGGTASEVFDSIRFIPLETTKESVFGSVDQLEVTDSLFIILDRLAHSILLFRRDGKFVSKIFTGGGDKYFFYFTLDRSANEIVATNNYENGLLVYDLHGRFLRKESFPGMINSLYYFPGKVILYNIHRKGTVESSDHILFDLCYSKGYNDVIKYVKPYNAKNEDGEFNSACNSLNFSGEPGSCMFSLPFDYDLYQLSDTGILCKYHFIFPLIISLPPNFTTDRGYSNTRGKYAYTSPATQSTVLAVERGYRYGDYLLYSMFTRQLTATADYNFAYNLRSGTLISFTRVTGDSTSCYLPLLSSVLEKVDAISDGTIFSSMAGFRLYAFENSLDKKATYAKGLKQYFTTGKKTDNPVMIQFRLKPNL